MSASESGHSDNDNGLFPENSSFSRTDHNSSNRYIVSSSRKGERGHFKALVHHLTEKYLNKEPCPIVKDKVQWQSHISGVPVAFPHVRPYPPQLVLMSKIISSCNNQKHSYIESPTGTGKTAALACAALAWQRHHASRGWEDFGGNPKTIIYATRTHSQVKQVSSELKRLPYRPVITVLGSRARLCTNFEIQTEAKETKTSLTGLCSSAVTRGNCKMFCQLSRSHYVQAVQDFAAGQYDANKLNVDPTIGAWDIEELKGMALQNQGCGYYTSAALVPSAHMVICPYNYILDPQIRGRRFRDLPLEHCVVLVDEAHNVEDVCRDAGSAECSLYDLLAAVHCLCVAHSVSDRCWERIASELANKDDLLPMKTACAFVMTVIDKLVLWIIAEGEFFKTHGKGKQLEQTLRRNQSEKHIVKGWAGVLGNNRIPHVTRRKVQAAREELQELKGSLSEMRAKLDAAKAIKALEMRDAGVNGEGSGAEGESKSVKKETPDKRVKNEESTETPCTSGSNDQPNVAKVKENTNESYLIKEESSSFSTSGMSHGMNVSKESTVKVEVCITDSESSSKGNVDGVPEESTGEADSENDASLNNGNDNCLEDVSELKKKIEALRQKIPLEEAKVNKMKSEHDARAASNVLFQETNITDLELRNAVAALDTLHSFLEEPKTRLLFRNSGSDGQHALNFGPVLETASQVVQSLWMVRESAYDYTVVLQAGFNTDLKERPFHDEHAWKPSGSMFDTNPRGCCRKRIHTLGSFNHGNYLGKNLCSEPHEREWVFSLGIWLMSPEVVVEKIAKEVHALVLTSGTLQPSHPSELGTEFMSRLGTNMNLGHVIGKQQLYVSPISTTPAGKALNGTFDKQRHLQKGEYSHRVGSTIERVLRTGVAAGGGSIVFLPSYARLKQLLWDWRQSGFHEQLENAVGPILSEQSTGSLRSAGGSSQYRSASQPQGRNFQSSGRWGTQNASQRNSFSNTQYDEDSDEEDEDVEMDPPVTDIVERYQALCKKRKSPILLAVYRAKLSEGIDFTDDYCRAVFCVSIPFPYYGEQIKKKIAFNDRKHEEQPLISKGRVWYTQQAFRALNQAMGRCIRHANDHGAIFLLDERFSHASDFQSVCSKNIPSWIYTKTRFPRTFAELEHDIREYSESLKAIMKEKQEQARAKKTMRGTPRRSVKVEYESNTQVVQLASRNRVQVQSVQGVQVQGVQSGSSQRSYVVPIDSTESPGKTKGTKTRQPPLSVANNSSILTISDSDDDDSVVGYC